MRLHREVTKEQFRLFGQRIPSWLFLFRHFDSKGKNVPNVARRYDGHLGTSLILQKRERLFRIVRSVLFCYVANFI
jgi:hypothetical protein